MERRHKQETQANTGSPLNLIRGRLKGLTEVRKGLLEVRRALSNLALSTILALALLQPVNQENAALPITKQVPSSPYPGNTVVLSSTQPYYGYQYRGASTLDNNLAPADTQIDNSASLAPGQQPQAQEITIKIGNTTYIIELKAVQALIEARGIRDQRALNAIIDSLFRVPISEYQGRVGCPIGRVVIGNASLVASGIPALEIASIGRIDFDFRAIAAMENQGPIFQGVFIHALGHACKVPREAMREITAGGRSVTVTTSSGTPVTLIRMEGAAIIGRTQDGRELVFVFPEEGGAQRIAQLVAGASTNPQLIDSVFRAQERGHSSYVFGAALWKALENAGLVTSSELVRIVQRGDLQALLGEQRRNPEKVRGLYQAYINAFTAATLGQDVNGGVEIMRQALGR